nr:MAG TPA: hypothetical protein [Caudoviricetes sp.]
MQKNRRLKISRPLPLKEYQQVNNIKLIQICQERSINNGKGD